MFSGWAWAALNSPSSRSCQHASDLPYDGNSPPRETRRGGLYLFFLFLFLNFRHQPATSASGEKRQSPSRARREPAMPQLNCPFLKNEVHTTLDSSRKQGATHPETALCPVQPEESRYASTQLPSPQGRIRSILTPAGNKMPCTSRPPIVDSPGIKASRIEVAVRPQTAQP